MSVMQVMVITREEALFIAGALEGHIFRHCHAAKEYSPQLRRAREEIGKQYLEASVTADMLGERQVRAEWLYGRLGGKS